MNIADTKTRCKKEIGVVETEHFDFASGKNEALQLACGRNLFPVTVAYETYGSLSPEKDNAILLTHALSGDAHVAGYHKGSEKPGWWDDMVGPGKAFDTQKYFVICSNVIGGCKGSTGPSSVNPATGKQYGLNFPIITIADMVDAQCRLVDSFGIKKLLCVAGGSMGGMQALQWAVSYPERVVNVIAISTALKH
jgi:homoserine O-acetyltransferase/O-succinyltransferase